MNFNIDILLSYGGSTKNYKKGEYIFEVGNTPLYYFQIITGKVKVLILNSEFNELIQGNFKSGDSLGEPPLIISKPYPSSAIALTEVTLMRMPKEDFLVLLSEHPEYCMTLLNNFANRIYNKTLLSKILHLHSSKEKIIEFFENNFPKTNKGSQVLVPFTRQEIADHTGLRVETVIRALIKLADEKKVKITNHKVYY